MRQRPKKNIANGLNVINIHHAATFACNYNPGDVGAAFLRFVVKHCRNDKKEKCF